MPLTRRTRHVWHLRSASSFKHLFAEITSMLEDAHELAAKGQAQNKLAVRLLTIAADIATAANGVVTLARSIDIVLGPRKPPRAKRHKGP